MSYRNIDPNSSRARRLAHRVMADLSQDDQPPANPPQGDQPIDDALPDVELSANPLYGAAAASNASVDDAVPLVDQVAAASQLLQSMGIAVGAGANSAPPTVHEKPFNLGLKMPVFKGEPDRSGRFAPLAVQDLVDRVHGYFPSSGGRFATEQQKLQSLLNAFPVGSPAATWWASVKRNVHTLADFLVLFKKQHGFDARDSHYVTEKFNSLRQRDNDTVVSYDTNFTAMVIEMTLVLTSDLVPRPAAQRARFLSGLKPAVKSLVMRTVMRHPDMTLNDVYFEAVMEERQLPKPMGPRFPPKVHPKINMMDKKGKRNRGCGYCSKTDHTWDDCPKIAQKKREGTWEERPPRSKN